MKEYQLNMKAYQFDIEKIRTGTENTIFSDKFDKLIAHVNLVWYVRKYQFHMLQNINIIWHHKGPKLVCKKTPFMTSFGILFSLSSLF